MGAGEADGGRRGWWGQARPMGAVSHRPHARARQYQTLGKPPGQIPSQHPAPHRTLINLAASRIHSASVVPSPKTTLHHSASVSAESVDMCLWAAAFRVCFNCCIRSQCILDSRSACNAEHKALCSGVTFAFTLSQTKFSVLKPLPRGIRVRVPRAIASLPLLIPEHRSP
jgi:hypothetical protein